MLKISILPIYIVPLYVLFPILDSELTIPSVYSYSLIHCPTQYISVTPYNMQPFFAHVLQGGVCWLFMLLHGKDIYCIYKVLSKVAVVHSVVHIQVTLAIL